MFHTANYVSYIFLKAHTFLHLRFKQSKIVYLLLFEHYMIFLSQEKTTRVILDDINQRLELHYYRINGYWQVIKDLVLDYC